MSERHIDISRSNYSVIDNEFGNMRDRFEAEMRRVEDEMKRLRQEFEGYRPGAPPPAISNQTYSQSAHNESRRQEPFGGKPLSLDCRNPTQIDQMLRGSVESLVMLWWMSTQPKTRSYIDPEHKTCPHKNNRVVMQA
ncbi:hypothetical protein RB195_023689 [Necator americanus]|uniref:Uncharacterized protein n=1 Tax=Necator americanus TaxID=51031 RepID=A0ABR1EKD0_NECAM